MLYAKVFVYWNQVSDMAHGPFVVVTHNGCMQKCFEWIFGSIVNCPLSLVNHCDIILANR